MREISLTQGKVALVSNEDYEWLNQWHWWAHRQPLKHLRDQWYAYRYIRKRDRANGQRSVVSMHSEVALRMGLAESEDYDHEDHNGLNNQRWNLSTLTRRENNYNQRKRPGLSSRFKWVTWDKGRHRWMVKLKVGDRHLFIGRFESEMDAARAANAAALLHYGEFALLNAV